MFSRLIMTLLDVTDIDYFWRFPYAEESSWNIRICYSLSEDYSLVHINTSCILHVGR
jgi:hypothetical protein